MADRPWLSETEDRLIQRKLPPAYVQRLIDELRDHLEDIKEETMDMEVSMNARLGEPEQVAEAVAVAHDEGSFMNRHPVVRFMIFAVSPLLMMLSVQCVVMMATFFSLFGLGVVGDGVPPLGSGSQVVLHYAIALFATVIPSVLLCKAYVALANRLRVGRNWMFVCCTLVALLAGLTYCQITFSELPGEIEIGFGLGVFSVFQLVQMIIPIAFGWWLIRRLPRHCQLAST